MFKANLILDGTEILVEIHSDKSESTVALSIDDPAEPTYLHPRTARLLAETILVAVGEIQGETL